MKYPAFLIANDEVVEVVLPDWEVPSPGRAASYDSFRFVVDRDMDIDYVVAETPFGCFQADVGPITVTKGTEVQIEFGPQPRGRAAHFRQCEVPASWKREAQRKMSNDSLS